MEFLQEFTFEISFCPGKQNQAADALSRRVTTLAISLVNLTLLEEIQQLITEDTFFRPLIHDLGTRKTSKHLEDYEFKEGLLFFKGRMCVSNPLQRKILKEAHESPLAAHLEYHKLFSSLKWNFFWPRMKKDALEFTK